MEDEREDRLRRQIEELVRSRLVVLEQDISSLQREVNESFTRLLERTDVATAVPESDELLAKIAADITAQLDTAGAESSRLGADIALLRDSVVELDGQHTQAEVLNALVARAANFAPRVVLFVVKGTNALAWAARGFEESGNTAIRGLSVSLQSDTVLRAALNSQQTFYGSSDQQPENHLIFSRLNNVEPQRVLAVTLRVRNKPAAVLYADSGEDAEGAVNVEANELLVHTAGLVIELVSLRTRMAEASNPAASARPAPQPALSGPLTQPARTSGPLPPPAPSAPLTHPTGPITQSRPEGSGELEQPAPVPVRQPEPSAPIAEPVVASTPSHAGEAAAPSRTGPLDEEEKLHNDARRFARLLVSEIKLYNEQKVADGRRHSDLYDRLKEDIDRSRQMYEKRVSSTVAAKFDYFYDELVNTLAEGNPSRLGSDHPGPSVRA